MEGLPRIHVVIVTFFGGLLIAGFVHAGTDSGRGLHHAEHNDVQAYMPSREVEESGRELLQEEDLSLYWSIASSPPAVCPLSSSVTTPLSSSSQTTTPAPVASPSDSDASATTTTTSTLINSCTPCTLSAPEHYPLTGCPQELQCGETCEALIYSHECMKPLSLHLSCPDDTEAANSSADWDLNLTLGGGSAWGDFAWIAFGGQSIADSKGPRLEGITGADEFDINCRVCSLEVTAVDEDPRTGYIRANLSFGPNIFIQDSCDSSIVSWSPSMGPSLEPTMGPIFPALVKSSPSFGPDIGPSVGPLSSDIVSSSFDGPSSGPLTTTSGSPPSQCASVYEDSIIGYAVFLVSSSQQGQRFYLDDSIAFIPKAAAALTGADVDPVTNCGCPAGAYSVEVEAALPSRAEYGDDFVFMVAPVLSDSEVVPVGVSTSLLQDSTTTTTTRQFVMVTITGELSVTVSDCEAYVGNEKVQEAWDGTIVELAECPQEWVGTLLSCTSADGDRRLTQEPNLLVQYTIEVPSSVNGSSSLYNESAIGNGTNQTDPEDFLNEIIYVITLNLVENLDVTPEQVLQEVLEQQEEVGLNSTFDDLQVNEVSAPVIEIETTPFTSTSTSSSASSSTSTSAEEEQTTSLQSGTTLSTTTTAASTTTSRLTTTTTAATTTTRTTSEGQVEQVLFTADLTLRNRDAFATDSEVLQSLTDTYASILDVTSQQVKVEIELTRRLATFSVMDAVARLLTGSVGNIITDVVVTVPAGTGQTQANIIDQLTEQGLQEQIVAGLQRDGIDPNVYMPIQVDDISKAFIPGTTTVSSTGSTATTTTTASTTTTTTSTLAATTTTQSEQPATTTTAGVGGGSSGGDGGGGGAAAIAIAIPVALVLIIPACVGLCYMKRKREHEYEGSDEDYDFIADMQRMMQESSEFLATMFTRGNEEGIPGAPTDEQMDEQAFTPAVPPFTHVEAPVVENGWTLHDV